MTTSNTMQSTKLHSAFLHRARLHGIAIQLSMQLKMRDSARKHCDAQTYLLRHLDRLLTRAQGMTTGNGGRL